MIRKILNLIYSVFQVLLSVLLTNQCKYCEEITPNKNRICDECEKTLPLIKDEKCNFCGAEKKKCNCKHHRNFYDGITAPFYYEGSIRTALHKLKFRNRIYLAHTLGKHTAESINRDFSEIDFDFITYVPFSKQQTLWRPYNQCEILAEKISKFTEIPLKKALIKIFDTATQHDLSGYDRLGNVIGIYDTKPDIDIKGKTILLIDDIKTTGATLNECARILKIRGAEKVYCACVAVTCSNAKNNSDDRIRDND